MAKLTLKLTANVYFQAQSDDPNPLVPPKLVQFTRGDVFEARSQEEYDRLIAAEAAVDPEREQERQAQELRDRRDRLEAEKAQLDAQLDALPSDDPSRLKGQALDRALDEAGLSKDGSADEKRARLADHLASQG